MFEKLTATLTETLKKRTRFSAPCVPKHVLAEVVISAVPSIEKWSGLSTQALYVDYVLPFGSTFFDCGVLLLTRSVFLFLLPKEGGQHRTGSLQKNYDESIICEDLPACDVYAGMVIWTVRVLNSG
ncbi:hypothetical protein MRB53_027454 [Persea americana]|uniref:Uncharacterized protein n=1 Tax=Persea americana TaxID=3435 RepID=A0ACC2LL62_PERAE|nr:hypothetical protein MRB53_027454 [Persea americana]